MNERELRHLGAYWRSVRVALLGVRHSDERSGSEITWQLASMSFWGHPCPLADFDVVAWRLIDDGSVQQANELPPDKPVIRLMRKRRRVDLTYRSSDGSQIENGYDGWLRFEAGRAEGCIRALADRLASRDPDGSARLIEHLEIVRCRAQALPPWPGYRDAGMSQGQYFVEVAFPSLQASDPAGIDLWLKAIRAQGFEWPGSSRTLVQRA